MNGSDIKTILSKRIRSTFLGVFAIDRLPLKLPSRRPLLLVCNTDKHDRPGKHWIVLYINHVGEYFDSLGQEIPRTFELYLNRNCNSFVYNNRQLQSSVSQFCGHYAVYYCLMRCMAYTNTKIINSFSSDTGLNDMLVHTFVCKLLIK